MLFNRKTTITETKLKRIAWLSTRDKNKVFNNLIHLFNEESLNICFHELSGSKAVGIDKISKVEYEKDLDKNISNLVSKMKEMAYIPGPARKVDIPKDSQKGKTRTLKISNFEDKIVQKMMQKILESIYEPIFIKSSYGFRTNIGPHDAIKDLRSYLFNNSIQTVIDVDITKFFDKLNHKILIKMLKMKIDDNKFIRYIIRMLKSGILTKGEVLVSDKEFHKVAHVVQF